MGFVSSMFIIFKKKLEANERTQVKLQWKICNMEHKKILELL